MSAPAVGGPGWRIDPDTLLPEITDAESFRTSVADDPCGDVLIELWSGRPGEALRLVSALLAHDPTSQRLLALQADCWRDCGDLDAARQRLEHLVADHAGTEQEAVFVQHLGKTLFVGGHYDDAADCFARALHLREQFHADAGLIASSRLALDRARQLAAVPGSVPAP